MLRLNSVSVLANKKPSLAIRAFGGFSVGIVAHGIERVPNHFTIAAEVELFTCWAVYKVTFVGDVTRMGTQFAEESISLNCFAMNRFARTDNKKLAMFYSGKPLMGLDRNICMKTIFHILLVLTLQTAHAAEISTQNALGLEALLPASYLDQAGFEIPEDQRLQIDDSLEFDTFPVFPMYRGKIGSSKFLGVTVPAKYLGTESYKVKQGQLIVISGNSNWPISVRKAAQELSKVQFSDGHHLNFYFHDGNLYGIHSSQQVNIAYGKTVGLDVGFGSKKNVVQLGENYTLGFSLNLGPSASVLKESGFNFAQAYQNLFDSADMLKNGPKLADLIDQSLQLSQYVVGFLKKNYRANLNSDQMLQKIQAETAQKVDERIPQRTIPAHRPVAKLNLPTELQKIQSELTANLEQEVKWRQKIKAVAEATMVVADTQLNELIQSICDHLAIGYDVPLEIWPRCHVAASFSPNAYAYPGGDIFITAGLIAILSDLDSVMLVLGHEIAHVVGRHTSKFLPKAQLLMAASNTLAFTANIAQSAFSLSGGMGYLGNVNFVNWFPKSMAASVASGPVVNFGLKALLIAPFAALSSNQRSHEWQADRFGHAMAFAMGAKQDAMIKGWNEFVDFFAKNFPKHKTILDRIMADHPSGEKRAQKFSKRLTTFESPLALYNSQLRLNESVYLEYTKYHEQLEPHIAAWVQSNKSQTSGSQKFQDGGELTLQTYLSPLSQCVTNALDGTSLEKD